MDALLHEELVETGGGGVHDIPDLPLAVGPARFEYLFDLPLESLGSPVVLAHVVDEVVVLHTHLLLLVGAVPV